MTSRVVSWISEHDENWPFFFLHLTLSVFLSIFFNLGFFLILILVHFLLDFLKHWHSHNRKTNSIKYALLYAFRDGFLLDFFLLTVAFAFGYVFHFTFAVALGNSARLLRFIELEDILRILSRLVVADWIIAHISWLTGYVREMDTKKLFMPPVMAHHEVLLIFGVLAMIGATLVLPLLSYSDYHTLVDYTYRELVPRAALL